MTEIFKNKGFTLIELLVVIAIIGILASIVISSLSDARNSAKDVAIKTALLEAVKKAEIYFDNNSTYDGVCDDAEFSTGGLFDQSISDNGGAFVCGDGVDGYCLSSSLNRGGGRACVDTYRELKSGFLCADADDTVCDL